MGPKAITMKFFCIPILMFLFSNTVDAQDYVKWTASYDAEQSSIILKAKMQDDWVIYSQEYVEDGPIPTSFEFEETAGITLVGAVEPLSEPIVVESKMFMAEVKKFKKEAIFSQKVELQDDSVVVKGNVTFMTCDSKRCLPPKTIPFEVKI